MSFQWTLAATFLYIEVFFIILLLLPLINPQRWQKIFKSQLVTAVTSYAGLYFNVILLILGLLLADAIRDIIKYKPSTNTVLEGNNFGASNELIKELRAQRNFHISEQRYSYGCSVIKRLLALISNSAYLMAESEASKKQAQSANRVANSLMDEKKKDSTEGNDEKHKKSTDEIKILKDELHTLRKQNENLKSVYDNLLTEYAKLESKIQKYEQPNETKKNF